ncbi:MAG TPA: mannitol dehydrogenase family protein [Steroidobacteraceae bacterium]|nr:mannitol dehydrogenase family protein [Steroidobacteraceae bacterium]
MDAPRLSERTLHAARAGVAVPDYARETVRVGVVHFGPGAFHRAHQAFYFDRLLRADRRWGICAVSLRSTGVRDALAPQDGLYALAELGEESRVSIIGALREVRVAPAEAQAIFARLESPQTRLVTITVTEKGYGLDSRARLDANRPEIAHDLGSPRAPHSLIGWLAEALRRRRDRGLAPFVVVSCDNLPDNGPTLRNAVVEFAQRFDRDLAAWIRGEVAFPRTMVDSITPASDASLRRRIEQATGLQDAWPVQREAFTQWVVERSAQLPEADWEAAGLTLAADVDRYERAKLRLVNGAHSTLAYIGLLRGRATVNETMADAPLARFVERLMREDVAPSLARSESAATVRYIDAILRRFRNPELRHLLSQIAWDGSKKLPLRLLPTVQEAMTAGRPILRLAVPLAAWMRFVVRQAKGGVPIVDPDADRLEQVGRACTGEARLDVAHFLRLEQVFPQTLTASERFVAAVVSAYESLRHPARVFESGAV